MGDYQYKTDPFEHQHERFELYRDRANHGHLWDCRTGKTKVTIDTAAYNYERGRVNGVVVIAPNGVHENWVRQEIPLHCPDRVRPRALAYSTSRASTIKHQRACDELLAHDGLAFLCVSYDGLTTKHGAETIKQFLTKCRCLEVLDEAHRIKSTDTNRTAWAIASAKHAVMRRILTGTLVGNEPFDVYAPLLFLDEGFWRNAGFATYTAFKNRFAEWVPRERYMGIDPKTKKPRKQRFRIVATDEFGNKQYRNLDQLNTLVSSITDRVAADLVLDMPPDVYETRYFEMTGQQRRMYDELRDDFITFFSSGDYASADMAIVRAMRLQQITCGYLPTDDGEDGKLVDIPGGNPRLDVLMDTLEDISGQGIIWARFTSDIDRIMAALDKAGESAVRYDGKVSDDQRADNVDTFQAGKARWFVGNAGAGGEGLPLYAADTVIYYSSTYKLIERLQSQDRTKKKGKTRPTGIIDIVCPGSVDECIIQALRSKRNVASIVVGDELKSWL